MTDELGTRIFNQSYTERPSTRFPNTKPSRDPGMSKRLIISATFSGSTITDAASTFTGVFVAGDPITIWGSAKNNGDRMILSVATHALTVDWPVQTEGPTTGVEVRTI